MIGIAAVCRSELGRIFALRPVFSVLILASALYAIYYPQPYLNEAIRKVPIAVVDRDGTSSSRELARRVDATEAVAVATVLPDLASAEREVYARRIYGILLIPKDFERDLLHGRSSPVALYGDASYFLMYQRIAGAVAAVAQTMGASVETARLVAAGIDPAIAAAAADPLPLTAEPLFNPQGGYATYLLPGAFVLLVQQILLIATGLLGTLPGAREPVLANDGPVGPVATVLGKLLAYLAIEALILPVYLVVLPYVYDIPRLGSVLTVLVMATPFVLAVGGLGLALAALFRSPLVVQLVCATLGLPFFFLTGFPWPTEAMPQFIQATALVLPSTSAIDGIVRVSQMGAPLSAVASQFLTLWGLALVYGALAVALESRRRLAAPPAAEAAV